MVLLILGEVSLCFGFGREYNGDIDVLPAVLFSELETGFNKETENSRKGNGCSTKSLK